LFFFCLRDVVVFFFGVPAEPSASTIQPLPSFVLPPSSSLLGQKRAEVRMDLYVLSGRLEDA
jgi:hypothetical protein